MSNIESLKIELESICIRNGWNLERTGASDSTTSCYYLVSKPTNIRDEYDCIVTIDADVRLSDHENQSRTSYHDNRLFNVAGGRFSDTLEEFERDMKRAKFKDEANAVECGGDIDGRNVNWKG